MYVDDLADACVHVLREYSDEMPINIGTGEDYTIAQLASAIKKAVGYEGELVFETGRPDGAPRRLLDISRITKLGWVPTTSLKAGLEQAYADFLLTGGSERWKVSRRTSWFDGAELGGESTPANPFGLGLNTEPRWHPVPVPIAFKSNSDNEKRADVLASPELLNMYKSVAATRGGIPVFEDSQLTVSSICGSLIKFFGDLTPGTKDANRYHDLIAACFTALFFPLLIDPRKEWEIHEGRKRVDIAFTNVADNGFFSHRRSDSKVSANVILVECKNYTEDLKNTEIDQLIGRFDNNRGKFGIIACRSILDLGALMKRCRDASSRSQGYIIVMTDAQIISLLEAKSKVKDIEVENFLHRQYRELLS
jgi:hypothetical protein